MKWFFFCVTTVTAVFTVTFSLVICPEDEAHTAVPIMGVYEQEIAYKKWVAQQAPPNKVISLLHSFLL